MKQKTGLIIFTIGWLLYIVASIMSGVTATEAYASYIKLAAFVIEFVGLVGLAKTSKNFNNAMWGLVIQFVLAIAAVVFTFIYAANPLSWELTTINILTRVDTVMDIYVLCSIVEGCAEISEKVKGMARTIEIIICVVIVAELVCAILASKFETAAAILLIVTLVLALVYEILIIVLLLRTIPKCKNE